MKLTLPPFALVDGDLGEHKDELPQIFPRFFIPRLQEKPQDPIMDTIRIQRESGASRPETPPEIASAVEVNVQEHSRDYAEEDCTLFWEHVAKREVRVQVS